MQHEDREEYREESLDMFDHSKDLSIYTVKIIGEYVENYNLELTITINTFTHLEILGESYAIGNFMDRMRYQTLIVDFSYIQFVQMVASKLMDLSYDHIEGNKEFY